MEPLVLSFGVLLGYLQQSISWIEDPRQASNGTRYSLEDAILPVIVVPGQAQVIALAPEFIRPKDGSDQQDCELEAAKRWLQAHTKQFAQQPITLLGDDLYSHQPLCQQCLELGMNFIFTALPQSHQALYKRLHVLDVLNAIQVLETQQDQRGTPTLYRYRYTNLVPLRGTQPALFVNWCELTITDERNGQFLYHNAFITDHRLDDNTVSQVVAAGRSRWKTENENHNVLKTKGYHLEHNFGHGQQHLAACLLTCCISTTSGS